MAAHVLVSHLLPSIDNRKESQNWKNNYTTECQAQIHYLNVRLFSVIRCRLNCIFLFRLAVLAFLPCFAGQKASPVFERCLIQVIIPETLVMESYCPPKTSLEPCDIYYKYELQHQKGLNQFTKPSHDRLW